MDAELRELCERLRGLLAMAVPAPWGLCQNPPNEHWLAGITIGSKSPNDARRIADICTQGARGDDIQPTHAANAELIVAAVNALPRLLDTIAAQAAELEGVRWRPIEGAAEGVPVLVTSPEWTDGVPAVAGYASQYDDWYLWGDGGVLMPKPTHWMPLPKPPAIADSGAGDTTPKEGGDE